MLGRMPPDTESLFREKLAQPAIPTSRVDEIIERLKSESLETRSEAHKIVKKTLQEPMEEEGS